MELRFALRGTSCMKWLWYLFAWVFGVGTCAYYAFIINLTVIQNASYLAIITIGLVLIAPANACLLLWPREKMTEKWLPNLRTISAFGSVISGVLLGVLSPLCAIAFICLAMCICHWAAGSLRFVDIWHWSAVDSLQFAGFCLYHLCVAIGPFVTAIFVRQKVTKAKDGIKDGKVGGGIRFATVLSGLALCILIPLFPLQLTNACSAVVADGTMVPHGLLLLRAIGDRSTLLRACYGEKVDMFAHVFGIGREWNDDSSLDKVARETYYRVTGEPFNTSPRPTSSIPGFSAGHDEDSDYDYLDWDDHDFAGETVGGVMRGLSLSRSNISGWVDPDESLSHLTWTMHFSNRGSFRRELRAQILLPPHAVVTGCELTIDKVKYKAIIGTRESTRQAYVNAAESGERPLMVSTAGAGRVLLQASTGCWGGDADLAVDITSPLIPTSKDRTVLPLPMFTERNFSVAAQHMISLTSSEGLASGPKSLVSTPAPDPSSALEVAGSLSNTELSNSGSMIFVHKIDSSISAADPLVPGRKIVQSLKTTRNTGDEPVVFVIDGSSTMAGSIATISDALEKEKGKDATIVWAADEPMVVVKHVQGGSAEWNAAIARLRDASCLGGQNNGHALDVALAQVNPGAKANIVWLHGPQPVQFAESHVSKTLTDPANTNTLNEYQVVVGPNEVVKSLDQCSHMVQIAHVGTLRDDLDRMFAELSGSRDELSVVCASMPADAVSAQPAKHPIEMQQLYGAALVFANVDKKLERKIWGTAAEKLNLVTPLTSALVLDVKSNRDVYKQFGVIQHSTASQSQLTADSLKQSSAANTLSLSSGPFGMIPTRPEPPMWLLILCALPLMTCFLWIIRRRKVSA